MIGPSQIKSYAFSYNEVESMINQWDDNVVPLYEGGIVSAANKDNNHDRTDFAVILHDLHPEYGISKNAISIYAEVGYIYTKRDADVIVIDGIQEGN